MASEMIEKIYDAEKRSESLIIEADVKAKEILDNAKKAAESLEKQILDEAKSKSASIIKNASDKAGTDIEEATCIASKRADELRESVKNNVKNGINEVINIIISK